MHPPLLAPCLPDEWRSFKLHYRYRDTVYHIALTRTGSASRVTRVTVDGIEQPDLAVTLVDDRREHSAEIEVG
jgi:cyclic beta-1,2-glucan glucanotransferase